MTEEFKGLLTDTFESVGREFTGDLEELASYMTERAEHLAAISHEPGFNEAVLVERDNVAVKAGILASRAADLADQRIIGVIQGAIRIAAVAL